MVVAWPRAVVESESPTSSHGGNLWGVGQVVDAGLHYFDTGQGQTLVEFLLQLLVDLLGT